ncbi:MAG: UDP-N-acetylglucosamine 1-carboxyvinyltransferase [Spirochaetaceae bacterium]|nr:UDP-N-acetylglucosamine 1-carboxyvinyltransferase [Spirochaetaceae bacterium]
MKYVIEGGYPLSGAITVAGNKNAALPCIAACLLTDEEVLLKNIPEIEDVKVMFSVIEAIGGTVKHESKGVFRVKCTNISSELPAEPLKRIRAAILFAGPILARAGKLQLPPPGGDVIGRRRLDTHFLALEALGARVEISSHYNLTANKLVGADIFLDEASVTATENAIMAAVLSEGDTLINNAACEPHVQDLCHMLVAMGAKIANIGSNRLNIKGVNKLHGCEFAIGSDFMEVGSFISLAACCRSELTINNVQAKDLRMVTLAFKKLGISWETGGSTIFVGKNQKMQMENDMGGAIATIADGIWPSFPADLMSTMIIAATQCEGTILFHEKMYESRMFFVDKLVSMGARIILCDPHRAVVSGRSQLQGATLASPDVRAGMAMLIAALCATGTSAISNIYQIERGYEHIADRLTALGAHIKKVES